MKCPHCNQEHPDGFQFCPVTGKKNELLACNNPNCPDYGKHILPSDSRFCPNCGWQLVDYGVQEIIFSVSQQELEFSASGGEKTITVTTNGVWGVGMDTLPWGHLTKEGSRLIVKIDANTGSEARTDYFTIKVGKQEKKVKITQLAWEVSGTSRSYTDKASPLKYIREQIDKKGECRLGTITDNGKGVVVTGSNGYIYKSIPKDFAKKIDEINGAHKTINSVALTKSGYYCVIYQSNGWFGVVPKEMKSWLNKYNNDQDEIQSISISENGNWAIVTNKNMIASIDSYISNMVKARDKYGLVKNVCITNLGICVVCQNGIYYSNIPSNLETKLKDLSFHPDHVTYTDSGTFLITTESGRFYYRI